MNGIFKIFSAFIFAWITSANSGEMISDVSDVEIMKLWTKTESDSTFLSLIPHGAIKLQLKLGSQYSVTDMSDPKYQIDNLTYTYRWHLESCFQKTNSEDSSSVCFSVWLNDSEMTREIIRRVTLNKDDNTIIARFKTINYGKNIKNLIFESPKLRRE